MALVIPVAHDFNCPWCWIGLSQVNRLREEFDVEFEWVPYELFPEELEWPDGTPGDPPNPNRPKTPSRFTLAMAAEGLPPLEGPRPSKMRTFRAHHAVEFAKQYGTENELVERLYRAHWLKGMDINQWEVIQLLCAGLIPDMEGLHAAIEERRFKDRIVGFDDDAYAAGVYNVPTFWIGEERYAEQTIGVLREALAKVASPRHGPVYGKVETPSAPSDRPYLAINMISTLDGKILSGERDEPVMDLGSKTDYATMRHLESEFGAVMIGAGSLRATPKIWFDSAVWRFVVSGSGNLDFGSRFFTDAPGKAFVIGNTEPAAMPPGVRWIPLDSWDKVFHHLRKELKIARVLIEGGSELNASLLAEDLVDELFMTIAPKVKLGRDVPTIADGNPLSRDSLLTWSLISEKVKGNELFLRYRRERA